MQCHMIYIPYTDTIGEEDVLEQVIFIVKITTLINFTHYIPKVKVFMHISPTCTIVVQIWLSNLILKPLTV